MWEEIFTICLSDKGLAFGFYKHSTNLPQKERQPTRKTGEVFKNAFHKREHSFKGGKTHGKVLNIIHHQGNAKQNFNEIPLHTHQDG